MGMFDNDPFATRFLLGLYGAPGSGKTSSLLDLARCKNVVFLVSVDTRAASAARFEKDEVYKGWLKIKYIRFDPGNQTDVAIKAKGLRFSFREKLGRVLSSIYDQEIPALLQKNPRLTPGRIWVAIDTMTHLQQNLLAEAQEVQVGQASPTGKKVLDDGYAVDRELTTQPEWGANAAVLSKIMNYLLEQPYNLVLTMFEKNDKDYKNVTRVQPALQGASLQRIMGDLDVILHLTATDAGEHTFHSRSSSSRECKDCFGVLPENIPLLRAKETGQSTLAQIRTLIFNQAAQAAEQSPASEPVNQ